MKKTLLALAALLPAACTAGPSEAPVSAGYRGIEEVRVLAKGME